MAEEHEAYRTSGAFPLLPEADIILEVCKDRKNGIKLHKEEVHSRSDQNLTIELTVGHQLAVASSKGKPFLSH